MFYISTLDGLICNQQNQADNLNMSLFKYWPKTVYRNKIKKYCSSYRKFNQNVLVQDESQLTQINLCLGADPASHFAVQSRRGGHSGALFTSRMTNSHPDGL